jgi:hypothetical protein
MPRVSTKSTDETIKPAPRKRAVRRTLTTGDDEVRAPRKRAPRKAVTAAVVEEVQARRAPTRFAAEATSRTKQRKTLMIIAAVLVIVSGLAAFIGSTDSGQINVSARIEAEANRQPQATESVEGGESGTVTVPVQNTPPAAISGLKGRGVGTALVEQPAPVTEEATSTEATASSTEEGTEEPQSEEATTETPATETTQSE